MAALQKDIAAYQNGFATRAEKASFIKQFALLVQRNKGVFATAIGAWLLISSLAVWFIINLRLSERNAVVERNRAETALQDLLKTAPTFYDQAKIVFEEGKIDNAIAKVSYAIQLDDTKPEYRLFRANLLESSQKLKEAAKDYRRVLELRPRDAAATTNLALCEKLLTESGDGPLGKEQQRELLISLRSQNRRLESAPLAGLIDPEAATTRLTILARLHELQKQPGWTDRRVSALPDGGFRVDLRGLTASDLVLKGLPITELNLAQMGLSDLHGLAGLPLKGLNLSDNDKLTDLSPLRGMQLEKLEIVHCPALKDLSPLRGMKLQSLKAWGDDIADLRPLSGMPLTELSVNGTYLTDLNPLRGAPLENLILHNTGVTSLEPLSGSPLRSLDLDGSKIEDLSPLKKCTHLEEVFLRNNKITDLSPLSYLPLVRIDASSLKITDIKPLHGLPLQSLSLEKTPVSDLEPPSRLHRPSRNRSPGKSRPSVLRKLPNLAGIFPPTKTPQRQLPRISRRPPVRRNSGNNMTQLTPPQKPIPRLHRFPLRCSHQSHRHQPPFRLSSRPNPKPTASKDLLPNKKLPFFVTGRA